MLFIRKLLRWTLQLAAGFVIVLALLVGVARLVLPEVSSFTGDIKTGVRAATGFEIDFRTISAGVSFYGPELRLRGIDLSWPDGGRIIYADRLVVSVDVIESISQRKLLPGRVLVEGATVGARISQDGELHLQGRPWRDLLPPQKEEQEALPDMRLQLTEIQFDFRNEQLNGPLIVGIVNSFDISLDDGLLELNADIVPGEQFGGRLKVEAQAPLGLVLDPEEFAGNEEWGGELYAEDFRLDPWLRLLDVRDLPVIGSEGDIRSELQFRGRTLTALRSDIDLEKIGLIQPSGAPVTIDWIEGKVGWMLTADGWEASGESVSLSRNEQVWPQSDFQLRHTNRSDTDLKHYRASVDFLRIDDLLPFVLAIFPKLPEELGLSGGLYGDLNELNVKLNLRDQKLATYALETKFTNLGYSAPTEGFELTGYSGEVKADSNGGDLRIDTRDARFGLLNYFRETLDLKSLQGVAVWRSDAEGHRIIANSLELETPHGTASASLELGLDENFANPDIDLAGTANLEDVSEVQRYLPNILPVSVRDWLEIALQAGRVPDAEYRLRGELGEFPFDAGQGEFHVDVNFNGAVIAYAPDWPPITDASGQITFDKSAFYSKQNRFKVADLNFRNVDLLIPQLREGILTAEGASKADFDDVLTVMRASPIGPALGPVFADVNASGPVSADLSLMLPVNDLDSWKFDADFEMTGVTAGLEGIDPRFEELTGRGSVNNIFVTIPEAQALLLGDPVTLSVAADMSAAAVVSHTAEVKGDLQLLRIWEAFGMPVTNLIDGAAFIEATALFPADTLNELTPFRLLLSSDMQGAISDFPYPLNKPAPDLAPTVAELKFPEQGFIDFSGSLRGIEWIMELVDETSGWAIERGLVEFGGEARELPVDPGLHFSGYLDLLVLQNWYEAFTPEHFPVDEDDGSFDEWEQMFAVIDLQLGELHAINHRFVDVDIVARPLQRAWDVAVASPWLQGQMKVPFSFDSGTVLGVDLDRMLLIEPLEGDEDYTDELDPRDMPSIKGRIDDFSLGSMRFGQFDLDVEKVADGVRSRLLESRSDSFTTTSSSDWLVIDNAQRTRLHMELNSTDFEDTLRDLDYSPMMTGKEATVITDLLWEGAPGEKMIYESTGEITLSIKNGIVREVEPGSGRILGLASVAALPRRLSLDFSELTDDGLRFDLVKGSFRIDFGDAWTCDLGLEGDIADMGIVGRVGLLEEDYDQVAVVRPHVSNLAPVAGAFLAGPAVGAATLLITQIFKKPLSGMGGSYYTITGSWDEPLMETADGDNLQLAQFSECESKLPKLSADEIKAMQGLIDNKNVEPAAPLTPRSKIGPITEE